MVKKWRGGEGGKGEDGLKKGEEETRFAKGTGQSPVPSEEGVANGRAG